MHIGKQGYILLLDDSPFYDSNTVLSSHSFDHFFKEVGS
ncbi:hypothetical protein D049_2684 [Vibrio parahaemolyticus VPTS-2010]|nr:hypothetical protein D049_2684 [Vibrio parahaemolyticus VPTS-2010]